MRESAQEETSDGLNKTESEIAEIDSSSTAAEFVFVYIIYNNFYGVLPTVTIKYLCLWWVLARTVPIPVEL